MDNIYYQSEISRTFLKEFNLFIDTEYNTVKINLKNIILKEITDEQLKYKKLSFNRWKNYVRVQQSNTK